MKVISVCNQKGGVGKTTTSINLSACLAQKGFKVLLIDLDPQANATSGVGIDKNNITQNIYHTLLEQASLDEITIPTKTKNLFIAPADLQLTGARIELISALGREQKLKKAIESTGNKFDYVLIDCPPSLGVLTINALVASNSALIPLQCEYYAMEGLSQLLNTVELVKKNLNPHLAIEGVLLTMADYRTRLTGEVIAEAKKCLKEKVYDIIVPRSVRLSEAPGYGEPIISYDKNSLGASAYNKLADEFVSRNSNNNNELRQKDAEAAISIDEPKTQEVEETTKAIEVNVQTENSDVQKTEETKTPE